MQQGNNAGAQQVQQTHPVVYQPLSVAPQHSHGEHTLALLDRFDFNSKLSFTIQIFLFLSEAISTKL